jgi:hypothetical protein
MLISVLVFDDKSPVVVVALGLVGAGAAWLATREANKP